MRLHLALAGLHCSPAGMIHTLYSQQLKTYFNWLTIPLIIINTLSSALSGAATSAYLSRDVQLGE